MREVSGIGAVRGPSEAVVAVVVSMGDVLFYSSGEVVQPQDYTYPPGKMTIPLRCISRKAKTAASSSLLYPTCSALALGYPNAAASSKVPISQFNAGTTTCLCFFSSSMSIPCYQVNICCIYESIENKLGFVRDTFIINIRSMKYHIHTMLDRHSHRVFSACMRAEHTAMFMSFVHTSGCLFISEVAVLGGSYFSYLLCTIKLLTSRSGRYKGVRHRTDLFPRHA